MVRAEDRVEADADHRSVATGEAGAELADPVGPAEERLACVDLLLEGLVEERLEATRRLGATAEQEHLLSSSPSLAHRSDRGRHLRMVFVRGAVARAVGSDE
jgi:hypothetical protein